MGQHFSAEALRAAADEAAAALYVDAADAAGRAELVLELSGEEVEHTHARLSARITLASTRVAAGKPAEALQAAFPLRQPVADLDDPELEGRLENLLGIGFDLLCDWASAVQHYGLALELRRRTGKPELVARALTNLGVAHARLGDHEAALGWFAEARAKRSEANLPARPRLLLDQAISEHALGRSAAALALLDEAAGAAEDPAVRGRIAATRGQVLVDLERLPEARDALAPAMAQGDPAVRGAAGWSLAQLEREGGRSDIARSVAEQALSVAEAAGEVELQAKLRRLLADLAHERGELAEAYEHLQQHHELTANQLRQQLERDLAQERTRQEVEALRTKAEQLSADRQALAEANAELRRLSEEKEELLAIASHGLRSPLAVMTLLADELLDDGARSPEHLRRTANHLLDTVQRMTAMLDRLLGAQRLQEHLQELVPAVHAASLLAEGAKRRVEPLARGKDQALWLTVEGDHAVRGDAGAVAEILDNLLSNAVKFSPRDCPVELRVGPHSAGVAFSVLDRGPGLENEDVERLFGKFARGRARATGGEASTGLGLFIARELALAMGGALTAEPRQGGGAIFQLVLPAG